MKVLLRAAAASAVAASSSSASPSGSCQRRIEHAAEQQPASTAARDRAARVGAVGASTPLGGLPNQPETAVASSMRAETALALAAAPLAHDSRTARGRGGTADARAGTNRPMAADVRCMRPRFVLAASRFRGGHRPILSGRTPRHHAHGDALCAGQRCVCVATSGPTGGGAPMCGRADVLAEPAVGGRWCVFRCAVRIGGSGQGCTGGGPSGKGPQRDRLGRAWLVPGGPRTPAGS